MSDGLWALLRADAERYEPDRALILARIEEADVRTPSRVKPLAVALAAASVLVVGTLAGWRLAGDERQAAAPVLTAVPIPGPSAPQVGDTAASGAPHQSTEPSASGTVRVEPGTVVGGPATAAPGGPVSAVGILDPHSGDYWAQLNVTVTVRAPVRALSVVVKVRAADGEKFAGAFTTHPVEELKVSSGTEDGYLLYRWTLRSGQSVAAGKYQFSAQYSRIPGEREPGADTFTINGVQGIF